MQFTITKSHRNDDQVKRQRISWPWKDMDVGDCVIIPIHLAGRGQVSAHVYGRSQSKSFRTMTKDDGNLLVERLA